MPLLAIECAVDHIAGIRQGRRQLTVQIRVILNNEQGVVEARLQQTSKGLKLATQVVAACAAGGSTAHAKDDFFVFVHAAGGWDVTLFADPRNARR